MHYFVTGASGLIGRGVVQELISRGHTVTGLARSEKSAAVIKSLGAQVHNGSLDDLASLTSGAKNSDGVAHLAFAHDFAGEFDIQGWCAKDRAAISALAEGLKGTNKPLAVTSGILMLPQNKKGTEDDAFDPNDYIASVRGQSETLTISLKDQGIRSAVLRLSPTNHGHEDHGFIAAMFGVAKGAGVSAYIGEGTNVWTAVHRLDTAKLFADALDKGKAGAVYHSVAEEGIPLKTIAEAIGAKLGVPTKSLTYEEGEKQFGSLVNFLVANAPASAEKTKAEIGWNPTHPTLLEDIKGDAYIPNA